MTESPSHDRISNKIPRPHRCPRRAFFGLAAASAGLTALPGVSHAADTTSFPPLTRGSHLHIADRETVVRRAYDLGYDYEDRHGGCARCSVAALQDAFEAIPENNAVFRAASCLDGGATPTRKANCGAFTGSGMVIGWLCGTERFGDNSLAREVMHQLHAKFVGVYGSVICDQVREAAGEDCPEVVGNACQWTAGIIIDRFS